MLTETGDPSAGEATASFPVGAPWKPGEGEDVWEVHVRNDEIVILGEPNHESDHHNCDEAGCGGWHVLGRIPLPVLRLCQAPPPQTGEPSEAAVESRSRAASSQLTTQAEAANAVV